MKQITHWIDDARVAGTSGRQGPVFNPATGAQTAVVDLASAAELDAAAESAAGAFPAWRATSLSARAEILFRFRDLVHSHRQDIARLITAEHGKVLSDALGEVARGLENVEFACGVPHLLKGGFSEQVSREVDVYSIRQPLGVVAGITYGNGVAIFTRDGGAARRFQFEVQAGMVGVNVAIPVPVAYYSFGGWKASLFGDTHMYGPDGIHFYTRNKVVTSRWPHPSTSRVDLGFPQNS